MRALDTIEEWERLSADSKETPFFVFKHSTRCPISAAAYERVKSFLASSPTDCPEVWLVNVIESRPVSNAVAATLGLTHQSPQMILVRDRRPLWSASHHGITADSIREALQGIVRA